MIIPYNIKLDPFQLNDGMGSKRIEAPHKNKERRAFKKIGKKNRLGLLRSAIDCVLLFMYMLISHLIPFLFLIAFCYEA